MRSSGIAETKLMAESANKRQRKVPGWYELFAKGGWTDSASSSDSETDDMIQEVVKLMIPAIQGYKYIMYVPYGYSSGLDSRLKKVCSSGYMPYIMPKRFSYQAKVTINYIRLRAAS